MLIKSAPTTKKVFAGLLRRLDWCESKKCKVAEALELFQQIEESDMLAQLTKTLAALLFFDVLCRPADDATAASVQKLIRHVSNRYQLKVADLNETLQQKLADTKTGGKKAASSTNTAEQPTTEANAASAEDAPAPQPKQKLKRRAAKKSS